jgi:hypothetical protein
MLHEYSKYQCACSATPIYHNNNINVKYIKQISRDNRYYIILVNQKNQKK